MEVEGGGWDGGVWRLELPCGNCGRYAVTLAAWTTARREAAALMMQRVQRGKAGRVVAAERRRVVERQMRIHRAAVRTVA